MKLSDFLDRLRLAVANLGVTGAKDPYLITLLNEGCDQVNMLCKAYADYTDFNVVAEKMVYSLALYVPRYLGRDPRGLYIKDSSDDWKQVKAKTEKHLKKFIPSYLNADSVDQPQYYWIEGDNLGFYPPTSTSKEGGARLYHLLKANPMSNDEHYPYSGSTTEITAFKPLDEAIIAYVEWKLKPSYGANTDIDLGYARFIRACQTARRQIKGVPDISTDTGAGMRIG